MPFFEVMGPIVVGEVEHWPGEVIELEVPVAVLLDPNLKSASAPVPPPLDPNLNPASAPVPPPLDPNLKPASAPVPPKEFDPWESTEAEDEA